MIDWNTADEWQAIPKFVVLGSDGTVAAGPTVSRQYAEEHAAAMNRTNPPGDNRHWRVVPSLISTSLDVRLDQVRVEENERRRAEGEQEERAAVMHLLRQRECVCPILFRAAEFHGEVSPFGSYPFRILSHDPRCIHSLAAVIVDGDHRKGNP